MTPVLHFPFPTAWTHPTHDTATLRQHFQELCDRRDKFLQVLDLECQPATRTACLESLVVTHVTQSAKQIQVHYEVRLSVFQACADQTSLFVFQRCASGVADARGWLFPEYQALPHRDTHEEF